MASDYEDALEALKAQHVFKNPDCICLRCDVLRTVNAKISNSSLPKRLHLGAQYHLMLGMAAEVISTSAPENRKTLLEHGLDKIQKVFDYTLAKEKKN